MIIGKITKVDGVKVVGTFFEKLPPYLRIDRQMVPAPQINSYVKTNVGLDTIVCQIVGEHEFNYDRYDPLDSEEKDDFLVDLEVRGRFSKGKFSVGLRCLPIVGAEIELFEPKDYEYLFGNKDGIYLGHNLFNDSHKLYLDPDKLIPSHIGIFGNTGSGKSNTLARIIRGYEDIIPPECKTARIMLFDFNNEYGGNSIVDKNKKLIFTLSTGKHSNSSDKLPLNINDLDYDAWGTLLRATQKTQMPVIRRAFKHWKDKDLDFLNELKKIMINRINPIFFSIRENLSNYYPGIESFSSLSNGSFFYRDAEKYCYISDIESFSSANCPELSFVEPDDELDSFLLNLIFEISKSSESGTNYDYVQPLISRAIHLVSDLRKIFDIKIEGTINDLFENKNLVIIQLAKVNSGTREIIPSLLTQLIFEHASFDKDGKVESITSIIIDEAHNILGYDPDKNDLIHDNTLRVFEKVIKEGRKYGVYLYVASQRPSDISDTITSQIHNYFIHKLVNPRDLEKIRKSVSFLGESNFSMITALGQGECIISGPSLMMPQFVSIDELQSENKPQSDDVKLFGSDGIFAKYDTKKEM